MGDWPWSGISPAVFGVDPCDTGWEVGCCCDAKVVAGRGLVDWFSGAGNGGEREIAAYVEVTTAAQKAIASYGEV